MAYLVDSDWLIDYLNGEPEAVEVVDGLSQDGIAISVISYMEVYEGTLRAADPRESRRMLDSFARGGRLLVINAPIVRECARLRLELRQAGRRVSQRALDLLVAATANVYGLAVVTRNVADYRDIPGVALYSA